MLRNVAATSATTYRLKTRLAGVAELVDAWGLKPQGPRSVRVRVPPPAPLRARGQMPEPPKFTLYGDNDSQIEESIQPYLPLRDWSELSPEERGRALQELINKGWLKDTDTEPLVTVEHLNYHFLRMCPGKRLHKYGPSRSRAGYHTDVDYQRREAAFGDFCDVFVHHESSALVFRMLSVFASIHIDDFELKRVGKAQSEEEQAKQIDEAFKKFDRLANCLNHVFEQFSVNMRLTRSGLVPMQDEKLMEEAYVPTLQALAHPQWKTVSESLALMFSDFADGDYPEVITKAHSAVQRFLQILVGQEGKSGKGEIGKLFNKAREEKLIPGDALTAPVIAGFQALLSSARATKSTAKPSLQDTTRSDALLVMNVAIVFMQYCLQSLK